MVTESYEEWDILIQKLKERDSHLSDVNETSELDKDLSKEEEE